MKKLLLLTLVLNLYPFLEGQAQSQMSSWKRPEFSPHSKRARFAKTPHLWSKEMEGDSSLQNERLRNSLPPHLRVMKNLPPHLLAERQWLLQSETENAPTGAAGLEPNDPLDRLYPPHKRDLAHSPNLLQNAAPHHSAQFFQSSATQILSGGVQEAWVARYIGMGSPDDSVYAMTVDAAGNIYVTGYSQSIGSTMSYLTVKYNAAGVKQWIARYNNGSGYAVAIAVDGTGNVYVTESILNGEPRYAYATIKYNSAGIQEWIAIYNGPVNNYAVALAVDGAGNAYVTGYSIDDYQGSNYATVKYNSAGTQEWVAIYDAPKRKYDRAVALSLDAAGNVYVTGSSSKYYFGYSTDYATVKYNASGIQEWVATYNGPENRHGFAAALALDSPGNVYVTGSSSNGNDLDYVTIKYNSAGIQTWVATYSGPQNKNDKARALAVDDAGNVYVAGTSGMVKYNSAGTQEWLVNGWKAALAVDSAGDVYVTGTNKASNGYSDYTTARFNSAGIRKWVKTYNGPGNYNDIPVTLGLDLAGNVYVTGTSDDSTTSSDYTTIKYDAFGVEQWIARHEESYHVSNFATAMAIDDSGNIYVTGYNHSFGSSMDFLTVKYDVAGVQQWTARYSRPGNYGARPIALAVDDAGNIYVAGYSLNYSLNIGTNEDYATIKYDAAGTQKWVKTYNAPGNSYDRAEALVVDGANNVYVTGSIGYYTSSDYATIKYNSAGIQEWVATYNGPGNGYDFARALGIDAAGNVYVTGYSGLYGAYDYATIKYDAAGTQKWVATYNGPGNSDDRAEALVVDGANNVYVTGSIWNGTSYDYATIKYNSAGIQGWAATYNGPGNEDDRATALAVDGVGNVYVTGYSGPSGAYNYATVKYNSAGEKQWVVHYGGPGHSSEAARALAIDGNSNVYVTGSGGTIKYNSAGKQEWIANGGVALTVDGDRNVYVAGSSYNSNTGYDYVTIKYIQIPIADAGPDKKICAGSSVPIGGSPTGSSGHGGPYAFSWSPTTGLDNPTAPNPIASLATTTTYTVSVTETATGLSATDDVTVTVPQAGWSVAHIVDVDDVIFGIDQGATDGTALRDNRGLALSSDERFLYLGYNLRSPRRLVRKIDLSVSDPANNHHSVVAQLKLPQGTQPARDIATDDSGRVYLALGTKIEIYNSNLQSPPLFTISGFTACEGVTTRRENGALAVYATDRLKKTLERFVLVEGVGEAITSSSRTGLDGDGEVRIIGAFSPRGLDIASNGTAWIADRGKGKVYRVNAAGSTVDSTAVKKAMDIALDETRGEAYVTQDTLRTIKVLNLNNGRVKRTLTPPAAGLNVNLAGETGLGALSGIDVASCQRVFVVNEKGRSLLTGSPPDSPFSNVDDNNDVKAADTDPVLVVTGSGIAKASKIEESEVASDQLAVTSYQLAQNYPNPFNPSTKISFALPEAAQVSLKIYDIAGQLVQTLVAGVIEAGRHQVVWDGTNKHGVQVASGVYFYQLRAGEFKQVRKMSLLR